MNAVLLLIDSLFNLYIYSLLAYVIISWLIAFKVINPWQPFVRALIMALGRIHEPLMRRIRSVLPDLGGIDVSPIILFLAATFFRNLIFDVLLTG